MRCIGRTKKFIRCKNRVISWYYPFCKRHHWWQPLVLLVSLGTAIIWINDLSESIGKKKLIEYFAPKPEELASNEPFSLTVFVHDSEGFQNIIIENSGKLVIDFDDDRRIAGIGEYGRTVFAGIPGQLRNQKVTIGLDAPGFVLKEPKKEYLLGEEPIYLALKKMEQQDPAIKTTHKLMKKNEVESNLNEITCKVIGVVKNASSKVAISGARVSITCDSIFKAITDSDGYFSQTVPGTLKGDQCIIRVESNGKYQELYVPMCNPNLVSIMIE